MISKRSAFTFHLCTEKMATTTTRRLGVAVDFSPCSNKALQWAVDNVVRDGDHLILVTIRPDGDYEQGELQLWAVTGSRN